MGYANLTDLLEAAGSCGSIGEAVVALECDETGDSRATVLARLTASLDVMDAAIDSGLTGEARSRSGLTGGDARLVAESRLHVAGDAFADTVAAALAVGEVNAAMGRVVAAPTGGASGVLPAVLRTVGRSRDASREQMALALAAAGGIGAIIAAKASLSGAASGCQAEIGSAAAMAAAAAVELMRRHARAGGSRRVPGAPGAARPGVRSDRRPRRGAVRGAQRHRRGRRARRRRDGARRRRVPDPVRRGRRRHGRVGRSLPPSLRETALGGLAVTPTGRTPAPRDRRRRAAAAG